MFRAVTYSVLSFLVVITAYLHYGRSSEEPMKHGATAKEKEAAVSSGPVTVSPDGKPPGRTSDPANHAKAQIPGGTDTDAGNEAESDRALAASAAEKFRAGDYESAVKLYDELSGRDKRALTGAGVSCFKLGDYERARIFLERAIEHNGGDFIARKFLAFVYYQKDDIERSLRQADFGLSLAKDPELRSLSDKLKKDQGGRETFIDESTLHFKLIFDGYAHGGMSRRIIGILEDAYSTVGKGVAFFPSEPVTVILLTKRYFHDITQAPEWATGNFDGKIRIPVRGIEGSEALLKKVLFHEYSHAVVHCLTPRCPLWINEGMAEYFSTDYPKKIGQVIPLQSLEESFAWLQGEEVGLAYWESYSAVSYLIDQYGIYRLKDFLRSLSMGTKADDAFKQTFGVSYSQFLSEWGKS